MHAVWSTGGDIDDPPIVDGPANPDLTILYRRLDARTGAWDAPIPIAGGAHPRLALTPTGQSLIAWESKGLISLAELDGHGKHGDEPLKLSSAGSYPSLAVALDGSVFLAWQDKEAGGSSQVQLARIVRVRSRDD